MPFTLENLELASDVTASGNQCRLTLVTQLIIISNTKALHKLCSTPIQLLYFCTSLPHWTSAEKTDMAAQGTTMVATEEQKDTRHKSECDLTTHHDMFHPEKK